MCHLILDVVRHLYHLILVLLQAGGGSGETTFGAGETTPATSVLIKSKELVIKKQIKILVLENQCTPAASEFG